MDAEAIKRSVSLVELAGKDTRLEQSGREYKGCCPIHQENTPSFTVFLGRDGYWKYHCFGCGAGGDVISYVQETRRVGFIEACRILGGDDLGKARKRNDLPKPTNKYEGIKIRDDAPVISGSSLRIWNPKIDENGRPTGWRTTRFNYAFTYRGNMAVLRIERGEKKITPQIVWADTPGGKGWAYMPFPEPRPLYGFEAQRAQVIVVQGEKKALELRRALGGRNCVVSAAGGDNAVSKTDWSVLAGKDVIIWPDADESGRKAALWVAETVFPIATRVRMMRTDDKSKGWDAGDYLRESGPEGVAGFIRERVEDWRGAEPNLPPAPPMGDYEASGADPAPLRSPPRLLEDWRAGLVEDKNGNLVSRSVINILLMLRHNERYAGLFRYDSFSKRVLVYRCPPWEDESSFTVRPVADYDYVRLEADLEKHNLKPGSSRCREAVLSTAQLPENTFNPASEYFGALKWDGVPRVDTWLLDYISDRGTPMFGRQSPEYLRLVGRKILCGLAARAMHPGIKFDTMPILEGAQYAGKSFISRQLSTINGVPYFLDDVKDINNKDTLMEMQGKLVVEFAEISAMRRAEINDLKGFLSRRVDIYRPPYGHNVIEAQRQCIFIGTMNPEGPYLRDVTGNRRYWPISCRRHIDLDAFAAAVPLLHAEAAQLVKSGEQLWLTKDEYDLCCAEQNKRVLQDVWTDKIEEIIRYVNSISTDEILAALSIPTERRNSQVYQRVNETMTILQWEQSRVTDNEGQRRRGYRRKGAMMAEQIAFEEELVLE